MNRPTPYNANLLCPYCGWHLLAERVKHTDPVQSFTHTCTNSVHAKIVWTSRWSGFAWEFEEKRE